MIKIGITGQAGFIGTHLYNTLTLYPDHFQVIPFEDRFFQTDKDLDSFVSQSDVIVHLAAMNRHADPEVLYNTNIELVRKLINAMERTAKCPYVIMSSSLQEERDNIYGRSKREGRKLLHQWANRNNAYFTGLIIPNVFGPFGIPFYNSVISTFSHQLNNDLEPKIEIDAELKLIYVADLVSQIIDLAKKHGNTPRTIEPPKVLHITSTAAYKVSDLLKKLQGFKAEYIDKGIFPDFSNRFEVNLFNTFRSYVPDTNFPVKYVKHSDSRGDYVEAVKHLSGGQSSYSTTKPGITRGNHFHTRKVERFAVIQGKASIKLRKYGTDRVIEYIVNGDDPGYVDMPVWYTHSITNIGNTELLTMFWINEFYDPANPDTYFEEV
ncbi:MAG TPA: NAD-dependent epimerase/dehydratase family protein [Candidatus Cloacimonadota bacterium]|nr:NAD-dependent epimerase/dehydratase family protein [Candidatus Cloacimonadota bacterium]